MKIMICHVPHEPSPSLTLLIEREMEDLLRSHPIDEARVSIESRPEASPAWRVAVHLVTPGRDFFAASGEPTRYAALRKVFDLLENEAKLRNAQRTRRTRAPSYPPEPLPFPPRAELAEREETRRGWSFMGSATQRLR